MSQQGGHAQWLGLLLTWCDDYSHFVALTHRTMMLFELAEGTLWNSRAVLR